MKKIAVICYTEGAKQTGRELLAGLKQYGMEPEGYLFRKKEPDFFCFEDGKQLAKMCFQKRQAMIFVCAAGIAVRMISPYVAAKQTDPAVVVIDERGHFVIPLLSGHLGGANELAGQCAQLLSVREDGKKATAVITTATELYGAPAIDELSRIMGWKLSRLSLAKEVTMRVLRNEPLVLKLDERFSVSYKANVMKQVKEWNPKVQFFEGAVKEEENIVFLTWQAEADSGSKPYLRVIPPIFTLGIGCKKNTPKEELQRALAMFLKEYQIDPLAIRSACSIDRKKEEKGILELLREQKLPYHTYPAETLLQLPGSFSHSDFVEKTVGVGNVCERSAVAGCGIGGSIYIPRYAKGGITLALAVEQGVMEKEQ